MSAPPGSEPLGRPDAARTIHWGWPVTVISLVLLLLITAGGGALLVLGQQRQVRALEQDLQRTRAELEDTREQLAAARGGELPAEDQEPGGGGLGGLLDGLLDGLAGEDGLGGMLDGLGGGEEGLLACLAKAMAPPEGGAEPIPRSGADEQVPAIAERVQAIRGLEFPEEVATRFLDGAEFEEEVREAFEQDYPAEDAAADERILATLGAIPSGFDLRAGFLDLMAAQAAGFYDTETQEIVVRADPAAPLSASEQVTLAHELEHALSDAVLGLPDLDGEDGDAARAALGMVEGGATLAMQQFAGRALGPAGQLGLALDPAAAAAQEQLRGFPHHLQRDLVFPYETGLGFACAVHSQGDWRAIDEAYASPPTTTAQILWPERYAAGEGAADPRPFTETPEGFVEARTTTLGAAELLWLFEAPGGDPEAGLADPAAAAAAWAGGTLRLLTREADTALGVALVQREGESDLCESVATWYRAAFADGVEATPGEGERLVVDGAAQDAVLSCGDGEVRLGIGPDAATARSAAAG